MNIYWFQSSDRSVHHAIVAENEDIAHKVLRQTERDIDPETFRIAGISEYVNLLRKGTGRHLAVIDGMGIELTK